MKFIFRIIILTVLTPLIAFSQSKLITGTVNDELGLPLPGATIQVKNSNNLGAITNFDGLFTLEVPSNSKQILIISYIGYVNEEVDVSEKTIFSINLQVDNDQLEEVLLLDMVQL